MDVKNLYGAETQFWKEKSDVHVIPLLPVIWSNVRKVLKITPDQDIVFLSPSANLATHEMEIFKQEISSHQSRAVRFIVGDYVVQPKADLRQKMDSSSSAHSWIKFINADGTNMPLRGNSVDVIWDRRGVLWNQATIDMYGVISTIKEFNRILKPGKAIVIDADEGKKVGLDPDSTLIKINEIFMDSNHRFSQEDTQPRDKNGKLVFNSNFAEDPYISGNFNIKYIGGEKNRIAILIKK